MAGELMLWEEHGRKRQCLLHSKAADRLNSPSKGLDKPHRLTNLFIYIPS